MEDRRLGDDSNTTFDPTQGDDGGSDGTITQDGDSINVENIDGEFVASEGDGFDVDDGVDGIDDTGVHDDTGGDDGGTFTSGVSTPQFSVEQLDFAGWDIPSPAPSTSGGGGGGGSSSTALLVGAVVAVVAALATLTGGN